jgi:hypothetical protein
VTTTTRSPIVDGLVEIDGVGYYAVPDIDEMSPFLMSVVSDGDRWIFVSSSGGLTAGRGTAAGALFPYVTDDRLHESAGLTGPVTAIRSRSGDGGELWTPFRGRPAPGGVRWLAKAVVGDSVVFEESHPGLGLRFRYRWTSSDRFGFIRTASLVNDGPAGVRVELVDGLVNLLPHGLDPSIYQTLSNLSNAYKRSEVIDGAARLAVYTLESRIVDRPEPGEVLRGTTAWSEGLARASLTVSPDVVGDFEADRPLREPGLSTGRPGAYLLRDTLDLGAGEGASWRIVADVGQDQPAVAALRAMLRSGADLRAEVEASEARATRSLVEIMAPADALQRTGDRVATAHQFANVTYNVMRGGAPPAGYRIPASDFARFLRTRNRRVAAAHAAWLDALPPHLSRRDLLASASSRGDPHLMRLGLEYLPFGFSRRHGDPSRPWNRFSIRIRDEAGEPVLYYEGNWRDIFQNWEALCMSFPEFLPGTIAAFVNASTPDGFNPYRVTRDGIDWEEPDPDDPWANIGYWGDHQIVYLLRLLEAADRFLPGAVAGLLGERWFSYADVPYRIAGYDELVVDPKDTIHYDHDAAARTAGRVEQIGADGKLLPGTDEGTVHLVTLAEKLLVPALSKLSSFVPGGGIWMNTQRPEWNDANNALVGYGLSMVTLYQLRHYLDHFRAMLQQAEPAGFEVSGEVADWLAETTAALRGTRPDCARMTDRERKQLMDRLGRAFTEYRARIYAAGFSGTAPVSTAEIIELCDAAIEHLDETIRHSRRDDGLYHSYNLVHFSSDLTAASVEHLQEMLEGQVAVLEGGVLAPEERADVLDALFVSAMFRADQRSFMLYPADRPPSFLDKNVIPPEAVAANPLLTALVTEGEASVITRDADGRHRFQAEVLDEGVLAAALDALAGSPRWAALVATHRAATLDVFEAVFHHRAYTGRSGSMYGYEGIGSIYWHMVAKLLVAVQQSVVQAEAFGSPPGTTRRLIEAYWRVRAGLGFNKTAHEFGAIPIDPYSHSPAHAGAQQPGMTGLVKEELITRPLEVGVRVRDGMIEFDPVLLRSRELLDHEEAWRVFDLELRPRDIHLSPGSLGMTVCQVPVVVSVTDAEPRIDVHRADGSIATVAGRRLDRAISALIFRRTGDVAAVHAFVNRGHA